WPTSKIKQHHRSPPVPLPPLNLTRRKKKSRRIPGRNRPILRHPRWSTTPSRDSGTRRIVSSGHQRSSSPQITKSTPKGRPFHQEISEGAVASGSLVQTKGKGASGSFKLASSTSGGAKSPPPPTRGNPLRRRIQDEKIIRQTYRRRDTSDKASSKTAKKQASPKAKKTAAEKKSAAAA
ncbi:unnamed protein product, partial [Tenebrio molitor]